MIIGFFMVLFSIKNIVPTRYLRLMPDELRLIKVNGKGLNTDYTYICKAMNSKWTRYQWMTVLMISSQLLLTGFVLYWLLGQYQEEKMMLHDQLKQEYHLVHDQLVDSMLMERLIIPSLDDSLLIQLSIQGNSAPAGDLDSTGTVVMMKQFFAEVPDEANMTAIHVEGFTIDSTKAGESMANSGMLVTSGEVDEERMVRSIKLFINENEEAFRSDTGLHVFAMSIDSTTLMHRMEQVLEMKGWNMALDWPEEDLNKMDAEEYSGIVVSGGASRYVPAMKVREYNGHLIVSILPQSLFALVMLVLSASALLFAYRNLKKQIALSQLRDDFIANISHELKTPVSTVKIALEALRKYDLQKDPKVSHEYLEMASSELERLEQLVGKVLHHEMLRNPSLELEKEPCDLSELVRHVLYTLENSIRECGASINVLNEDVPCMAEVDPVYMEGVIINLIDNSLKYAGPEPEIVVLIKCQSSGASLSVRDNGPGIPDEYSNQIFEKFFRVPARNKHNVKGYGLGLNFASQVMMQHGGSISLKHHSKGGAIFTLHFPNQKE